MKPLISIGLYIVSLLLLPSYLNDTAANASTHRCNSALSLARSKLPVDRISITDIGIKPGQPKGKTKAVFIAIQGNNRGSKAMDNESLQLSISRKIINSCPEIVMVSYQLNQSDYAKIYGLINNRVSQFSCQDPEKKINWGEYMCL